MPLRPYQQDTLSTIVENYRNGIHRQVVSAATGVGKTFIFANLPSTMRAELPGTVLVLVHMDELVFQNAEEMRQCNPNLKVGIEKAELHAPPDSDIIVASVATLGSANKKRRANFNWDAISICICDECHHSLGQSYVRIFEAGGFLAKDSRKLLCGFTATTRRSDGAPLAEIYEKIVYDYPMRRGIEEHYLSDVIGIRVDTRTCLDAVHTSNGDFKIQELSDAVNTVERNNIIAESWAREAQNRKTVVFTVDIQHAKDIATVFQQHGIAAEACWGVDPLRAEKLARFKSGETAVLTNCQMILEGVNIPSISCVVLARPTKSSLLFQQAIGRGTRLCEGKENLLVIDVSDSTKRHSLVTLPSLFGMPAKINLRGGSAVATLRKLEEVAKEYPNIDLSELTDLDKLQEYITAVNFWDAPFAAEVEQFSKLSWHRGFGDNTFVLSLPAKERLEIKQNILGTYDVSGVVKTRTVASIADSLERAFQEADAIVGQHASEHMIILRRKAGWHSSPATEKQLATLGKLMHGKPIPAGITKGEAAKVIGQEFAKRNQEQVSTPATAPQLRYIHALQRQGLIRSIPEALSKHDAGRLISQAKSAA